jgi:hypothetical protein
VPGITESYVHRGRIGVLLELSCETDFLARTDLLQTFAKDLVQHIAGANPTCVSRGDVPAGRDLRAHEILLEQVWIRDHATTIEDLLEEVSARAGEQIVVRRFARFELGEPRAPDAPPAILGDQPWRPGGLGGGELGGVREPRRPSPGAGGALAAATPPPPEAGGEADNGSQPPRDSGS